MRLDSGELEVLYQTALEISAQLDRQQLFEVIIKKGVQLLNAENGGIYLFDVDRDELTMAAQSSDELDVLGHKLMVGEGLAGRVAQTAKAMIVDDYGTWSGRAQNLVSELFGAVVAAPIGPPEGMCGVLYVADSKRRVFTERDAHMLTLLASHAAIAIKNALRFEVTKRNLDQMQTLYEVSTKFSTATKLDDIYHILLRESLKVAGAKEGSVMILDSGTNQLETKAVVSDGTFEQVRPNTDIAEVLSLARWVKSTGKAHLFTDDEIDPAFSKPFQRSNVRSMVSIPLVLQGRAIGILYISSDKPNFFRQNDLEMLTSLVAHAADAIESQGWLEARIPQAKIAEDSVFEQDDVAFAHTKIKQHPERRENWLAGSVDQSLLRDEHIEEVLALLSELEQSYKGGALDKISEILLAESAATRYVSLRYSTLINRKYEDGLSNNESEELDLLKVTLDEMDEPYYEGIIRLLRKLMEQE